MTVNLDKEQAKLIVTELLDKAHKRFKQELAGENEEFLDRVVRQYRAKVARCSWKASQKWCKWNEDGPVLMPDYTRLYYRKGNTEVVILEYPPQVRMMKFTGSLVKRDGTGQQLSPEESQGVHQYSLALPYVVFLFKYVNGLFTEVKCAFSDRPLRRLEEKPLRPYMSNIDSNLTVCLGLSLDRSQLIKDNVAQQSAFILSHFWQTVFSDEWSQHFWNTKTHFQQAGDSRVATMEAWQEASIENPLFVIESVNWLQHSEDNFGDIVVRMFDDDASNLELHEDLYKDLVNEFLKDVTKTFQDNLDSVEEKVVEKSVEQLADELLAKLGITGA